MLCSPRRDLTKLRQDLMACFRETNPSRQFHCALFLGLVRLHLVVKEVERTRDLKERRTLIHEFTQGQKTIQKAIGLLQQSAGTAQAGEAGRRALP